MIHYQHIEIKAFSIHRQQVINIAKHLRGFISFIYVLHNFFFDENKDREKQANKINNLD